MEEPKVSIILPTYNRDNLIARSIKSILNQSYQDFELIIVDDGSTDNTPKIVKKLKRKDERIRYLKHEKNHGAAKARNTGIVASKSDYLAFQDSGDLWLPRKLEKQIKTLNRFSQRTGVVYTRMYRLDKGRKKYVPLPNVRKKNGRIHGELLKGNFIGTPSILAKRECFDTMGKFDERLPRLQDWDLVLRFSKKYQFRVVDEPLVIVLSSPDSISTREKALTKALILIFEKYSDEFQKDRKILSKYLQRLGYSLLKQRNYKKGFDFLEKSKLNYPFNIKSSLLTFLANLTSPHTAGLTVNLYINKKNEILNLLT